MFKNKPRKNRAEFLRSSKLRLENLEERQLLTAVGAFDVPYGPDPAPVVCAAAPEVDDSPTVDLSNVAANAESELVLATTGNTLKVTTLNDSGDGSLRAAIASASAGDTITFDASLKGNTILLDSTLEISESLTINASDLYENGTPGITIDAQSKGSVICVSGEGKDVTKVVINGLTLTNGSGTYDDELEKCVGGGIFLKNSSVETANTTILKNTAVYGGGVFAYTGAYTSSNTTISENTAVIGGGAVCLMSGSEYTSINTTISNNMASYYGGGGVFVYTGTYMSLNTTISNNISSYYGGGVFLQEAEYTSINTTISNNISSYYGGGVHIDKKAKYTSINTTISNNTATKAGGGVCVYTGTYTSSNTTISNNTVTREGGGGIMNYEGVYTSLNTTISGNAGPNGGGVYSDGVSTVKNSIIVGNTGSDFYKEEGSVTPMAYYTLSSFTEWGEGSSDNITFTEEDKLEDLFDMDKGDYSLKADSKAIDAGNNKYVTGEGEESVLVETDRDGKKRIRQGKDGSSQTVDIGAYEFVNPNYPVTIEVTSLDDVVDPTDGVISFREAVQSANDGDTIKFASSETSQTISVTSTILLDKNITIDGTGAKVTFDGGNANRIFNVASGKTVELKNLTLQKGASNENGGAIYNDGNLTLTGVVAKSNSATKNGGAIFNNFGASLTVKGGSITGNVATKNGGAFANYGTMTIEGADLTLISKNTASRFGGAYFGCGTLNVTGKSRFEQNEVTADGSKGGAIYNDVNGTNVGTVSITGNVVFSDNKAVERGGAIMSYSTDANAKTPALTVKGTTIFVGNEALQYGGAIDVGQGCSALLGGNLSFNNNKATSTNADEGFGGAIFSVATLKFEAGGTYMFENNTATKSGGAIDACDGTLTLAGNFTFSANEAKGVYKDDQTGLGGSIATAAVTTVANGTTFEWENVIVAARGNCVALDSEISPELTSASFNLEIGSDYSTFKVIRSKTSVKPNTTLVPSTFASNAVVATITTSGVSTTFGAEGVTPEQLGLDAGTHEALIQYADANGVTSAVYSLVLTVDSAASLAVRETSFANDRGVKFDFNLTNADGRAVSVWEISWGDGTTSRLEKLSTSWLAAHYYAQDGTFDVSLMVAYLDGTSETFEAFATQTIGAAPVATTGKADAFACVFAEPEDLFDEFEELGNLIGPMPLR